MQSTSGRVLDLQNHARDAELQIRVAGDLDAGTTMNDLQVEDLDRPTTHKGDDMPEDQATHGSTLALKKRLVESATAKTNGMSPISTAKKAFASATPVSGITKPTGSKPTSGDAIKSRAPALKKSTTSPPAVTSKPALASSTPSKPTNATNSSTRRMSVIPAKVNAPGLAKQSLSASPSMKPSEDATVRDSPTGSIGSARSPIVTPAPSRPRASVSEAIKKPPTPSRPSIAGSAKPAGVGKASTVARSSAASTVKPTRPTGSISSIKELKEGEIKGAKMNEINELKGQLEEANKSLGSKTAMLTHLEGKIAQLEESLASVNAELDSKTSSASELENSKVAADSLLAAAQEALNKAREELAGVNSTLDSVTKELSAAKANALTRDEVIQSLQTQKDDLEAAVASYKERMMELEANHAKDVVSMTEAASVEREDHLKTQTELRSRVEDIEAQKVVLAEAVKESEARIAKSKAMTEEMEALQARLTTLSEEKEENANKVSELEIEILELKETQETLEDVRDALQGRVDELLRKLADAADAAKVAADAASKENAEHSEKVKELSAKHKQDLEHSAAQVVEIATSLDQLKAEYDKVVDDLENMKKDVASQEEQHNLKLDEVEKAHADVVAGLSSQLAEVSKTLNEQESIYDNKVNDLNAEHAKLLEEAFARARREADEAHSLELQEVRHTSNSAIQQLQEANANTLKELKAEHASAMESEKGSLNKAINNLNLELKATQADLAKAKSSLEASRSEIALLTRQRDDARAQADAAPPLNPEQDAEIIRLEEELESAKGDLAQTTNTLALTKMSMAELSDKHEKESEAVAKGRADEVVQLRAAHDAEVSDLATQKTELLIKVSDLEGELMTAKTALAAHEAASPKVNGTSHSPSSTVAREELQKLHEAHNLKIHDMQADHDKALKLAKEELEMALSNINDLQQDIARKDMEIQFLGQDQEESQEHIARLKADVEALSEKPQPA